MCKAAGLTGRQGVMVPKDNIRNLVLREDVVEAVREGNFHIYGVSSIDEGIEVLTGVPAGDQQEDGGHPEGTVHQLVESRLHDMALKAQRLGKYDTDKEEVEEVEEEKKRDKRRMTDRMP